MPQRSWSLADLRSELERYEVELRAAGKGQLTMDTYVGQSERFVRFLTGISGRMPDQIARLPETDDAGDRIKTRRP